MHKPHVVVVNRNGGRVKPNLCILPDRYLQTFSLTIQSAIYVTPGVLKELLEKAHEVTALRETTRIVVAKNGYADEPNAWRVGL